MEIKGISEKKEKDTFNEKKIDKSIKLKLLREVLSKEYLLVGNILIIGTIAANQVVSCQGYTLNHPLVIKQLNQALLSHIPSRVSRSQ